MTVIFSGANLNDEEFFRLNGTLSPDRIEVLLDRSEMLAEVQGVDAHIKEAMGQFPAEDFLAAVMTRMRLIAKRLRGDNKEALLGCIESLDDIAQCTFNAADYGRSELREALKAFSNAV